MNRRLFLKTSAATTAGLVTPTFPALSHRTNLVNADQPEISVFTKPFNSLSFSELADAIADIGFDGIEAPIRAGGHLKLDQIESELPQFVAALKQRDLKISIMASDLNDPNDPQTERMLRAAVENGITRYRLKYFKYSPNQPVRKQLANWKAQLTDLAALNQQLGIIGLYQNHAGKNYFGAGIWDLGRLLDQIETKFLGVAYDIRHASVEGGLSWPVTLRMIMPHVKMLYVKDFRWRDGKVVNVPLGSGQVDRAFLSMARSAGFQGPISLHEEYLSHKDPKLVPKHLAAMKTDLETLKSWLGPLQSGKSK